MLAREPKVHEEERGALFMRGTHTTDLITEILKDLHDLKKPNSRYLPRRNEKRPFEDETSLEFLCEKNEASLFGFGSHSKKRPNNLILGRLFNYKVYDMYELSLTNIKTMSQFKPSKFPSYCNSPCIIFQGDGFEHNAKLAELKSLFLDMFQHMPLAKLNLVGLEHVVVLTAQGEKAAFRHYGISLKKSGGVVPRVVLEELGPRFDMEVGRSRPPASDVAKEACRAPKQAGAPKLQKNFERNAMGDTMGRIHMERQSLDTLQTRKVRGLKRGMDKALGLERDSKRARAGDGDGAEGEGADGDE